VNADRLLKEFILKLSTKHNNHGLFDKIINIKSELYFSDSQFSRTNSDNKNITKLSYGDNK
jgi:hypothetical protein